MEFRPEPPPPPPPHAVRPKAIRQIDTNRRLRAIGNPSCSVAERVMESKPLLCDEGLPMIS